MGYCCVKCFDNVHIIEFIKKGKKRGKCDYCGCYNTYIIDTISLGELIREKIWGAYDDVQDSGTFISHEGYDAFEILTDYESVFSESIYDKNKEQQLFNDLISDSGPSYHEIMDGAYDDLDGAKLVIKNKYYGVDENRFVSSWQKFKYQSKHYARFFDLGTESETRESLLSIVSELLQHEELVCNLKRGASLDRVRPLEKEEFDFFTMSPLYIQKQIGPPPYNFKNNRMSPAGISYMYLSDEVNTCILETKPTYGQRFLAGTFKVRKSMKLLDLCSIPSFQIKSIFDPQYDHEMIWAKDFMKSFIEEISKPISDKDEILDYIPTQILAEYIRKLGYEGIKYESSIIPGKYNYAIFYGPELDPYDDTRFYDTLEPFTNKVQLAFAALITYEKSNNEVFRMRLYENKHFKRKDTAGYKRVKEAKIKTDNIEFKF